MEVFAGADPVLQALFLIAALAVAWVVLRFILKLTMKIFSIGCALIILLGLCTFVAQLPSFGG